MTYKFLLFDSNQIFGKIMAEFLTQNGENTFFIHDFYDHLYLIKDLAPQSIIMNAEFLIDGEEKVFDLIDQEQKGLDLVLIGKNSLLSKIRAKDRFRRIVELPISPRELLTLLKV